MAFTMQIIATIHAGVHYYEGTRNGVKYTAHQMKGGAWWVSSHRLALGPRNAGGGKYYDSPEAVAAGCKALEDLPARVAEIESRRSAA